MIELRHVSKSYRRGDQSVPVLRDLSLVVRQGEFQLHLSNHYLKRNILLQN